MVQRIKPTTAKSGDLKIGYRRPPKATESDEGISLMRKKSPKQQSGNYEVGKGRPPRSTRWKPGQSGNPKGRPKGAKNLATIFNDALNQKFDIQEKGKTRKITAREGIVRRLVHEALKGNIKATAFVLAKEPEIARNAESVEKITRHMTAQEAAEVYARTLKFLPK
jgi:Family of unknown function (DUF5681)